MTEVETLQGRLVLAEKKMAGMQAKISQLEKEPDKDQRKYWEALARRKTRILTDKDREIDNLKKQLAAK